MLDCVVAMLVQFYFPLQRCGGSAYVLDAGAFGRVYVVVMRLYVFDVLLPKRGPLGDGAGYS